MEKVKYRSPAELKELVDRDKKALKNLFLKLKGLRPNQLDSLIHPLHDEAFQNFDCLNCANCCSTISPIITVKDIDAISRKLKIKPARFIEENLHIDEENDYVFKHTPCPFLLPDNFCMVYESRPKACREYPHTNRRKMHHILKITLKNCEICPVVYTIVLELGKQFN
ncbi:MAG: YkgJ family cysteine cluster protein [Prolixibacteraceae bacterium]|nr:YkgJ family cysteine cluster protein [Prolixibacteraceae bacterium]